MAHYVHDEKNNRIEALSKEEIYALLAEAIQEGELPSVDEDTAFVTMFKSIVDGKTYKMAFCTQAQYNQLEAQGLLVADAYYIITDDETYDDLETAINNNTSSINQNASDISGLDTRVSNVETNKLDKESSYIQKGVALENENGVFTIYGYNNTDELRVSLKVNGDTIQLLLEDYYGTVIETYNLLTVLGQVATNTSNIAALTPIEIPVTAGSTSVDISSYGAGLYIVEVEWNSSGEHERFTRLMTITNSGTVITGSEPVYYAAEYINRGGQTTMRIDGFFYMYMGITPTGTIGIPSATSDMKLISCKKIS